MHKSSYVEMAKNIERYFPRGEVYDFGAFDVNGSYRPLFAQPQYTYVGIDRVSGKNVDVVMVSEFNCGLLPASADAVISGQCLEHCANPFRLVGEMWRVCRAGGVAMIVAPYAFPQHRYPIDCWRFLPDGMAELLKQAGFAVVKTYLNACDCWGIGRK